MKNYYKPENIEIFKQALNDARQAIRGGERLRPAVHYLPGEMRENLRRVLLCGKNRIAL